MVREPQKREQKKHRPKIELGKMAHENYKARITHGLLGVGLGEGDIVEILNFRSKRILSKELFDDPEEAKRELSRIREDIKKLTTEEFIRKHLQSQS
ncbi:MAG: hypothetical protein PHP64_06665 [Actinomycetota bacterium]|nr:hypothetical protein [Actinomycetota bacterium]